jgi:hypothetical protein
MSCILLGSIIKEGRRRRFRCQATSPRDEANTHCNMASICVPHHIEAGKLLKIIEVFAVTPIDAVEVRRDDNAAYSAGRLSRLQNTEIFRLLHLLVDALPIVVGTKGKKGVGVFLTKRGCDWQKIAGVEGGHGGQMCGRVE